MQNPLAAVVAKNPSNALVPLKVDASGNLLVATASGDDTAITVADGADVAQGAKADAAWASGSGSEIAILKAIALKGIPAGSTALITGSGIVSAAIAAATLAAASSKTTYITGFDITAGGATAGVSVDLAVSGLLGGTIHYSYTTPVGATVPAPVMSLRFPAPVPASAANTAIVVTLPSLGTGNLSAAVVAYGFQL